MILLNYYIADMHFSHKNVIKYDNRPFTDLREMQTVLINNWNNAVNADDCVYILGDLTWKNSTGLEVLMQLKGRKFLILGNHDKPSEEMRAYFEWIKDYAVIEDNDETVVLFHYPIASWYGQFRNSVHLFGHVHGNRDYELFMKYLEMCADNDIPHECYNVGCMMPYMDYTPRTLTEIRERNNQFSKKYYDNCNR